MNSKINHQLNQLAHSDLDGEFYFEIAIRLAKNNLCVRRKGWRKDKTYITLSACQSGNEFYPTVKNIIGVYISIGEQEDEADRRYKRYVPTDADWFADDWYLINPDIFFENKS